MGIGHFLLSCVLFFLFGVHYYPPLAFGFGIYGMQPSIEKHFVHINRLFGLGVYVGGN